MFGTRTSKRDLGSLSGRLFIEGYFHTGAEFYENDIG
jgi:hypothetical protein